MTRFLVVTGTDTEVGKTHVTANLAALLRAEGRDVCAIKPIESGTDVSAIEDGVRLARATGQTAPTEALVRLRAPIAPPAAADLEGVTLDFDAVIARVRAAAQDRSLALVEGAGGLLSPLTWAHTTLDLITRLRAQVIVVAADRLGTLNHTLLTLRALSTADGSSASAGGEAGGALALSAAEGPHASAAGEVGRALALSADGGLHASAAGEVGRALALSADGGPHASAAGEVGRALALSADGGRPRSSEGGEAGRALVGGPLAVVFSAPAVPDASTTRNAAALRRFWSGPVLEVPRADDVRDALRPLLSLGMMRG